MRFKEYPKMIYPEGKDPVVVKSKSQEDEFLKSLKESKPFSNKQDRPEDPNNLRCRYCGKEYLPMHKQHLTNHEPNCDMNPENKNANRDGNSKADIKNPGSD